ncbi:ribonuclease H-like domain-containing protein [Tanacetum coccineum]|uniref:Ribonuclease H-like domain-containing protein n=1 Tax=Tanacetum coccineum TaxID=301880 RepID=A0ABQ5A106_9ASTR
MDLASAQNNTIAKLPLLKQGDYEMWRLKIEQYIQLQDYALWEIIENGNSFTPVLRTTTNVDGTSTSTLPGVVTVEERTQKRNDDKARSIILMAIPNEHQLTFNQYKNAKTLFEAIQSRFDGNDATKKTQKTLLKQTYENFNALSSESLDSIFNRLQKIVSQLSILGVNISQEDLNLKFLRSFPAEWNTHVNMAFVSTPGSTNEDTAHVQVSTASTPVSAASTSDNAASLKQIHDDDLEEIDLKWQLALLSMRAKKFYQRTGKKITINGSDTTGFDKTKVECFNCHKLGHFANECRNPRSQEGRARSYDQRSRNQESIRRTVKVEETSPKAMIAVDGAGFDWSFMAEEEVPTNMALMAFSDSEVLKDKTCSNMCLKSFETLKTQYDKLRIEHNKTEFDLANYKRGLASVEEQLVFYKQNEVMFTDKIAILKRDASFNESEIIALKIQIEKLKKDKEDNLIKIDNYDNATKNLDKVIGSQIPDNNRKGVGYNVFPPPPTGLFAPPSVDLSNYGIEEFKEPKFEGYSVKVDKIISEISSKEIKKTRNAPIIKDWVFDCDEDETVTKVLKSVNVQQKPKQANEPRNVSQIPRYNRVNKNELNFKRLGVGFQSTKRTCFVCGSLNHQIKDYDFHDKKMRQKSVLNKGKKGTGQKDVRPIWNDAMRSNHQNFSNTRRNFTPKAVLTKSGRVPISTVRQSSSRVAVPVSTARPVNTAAPKSFVNVAKYRTNTERVTSAIGKQGLNAVKPSACWVWRPKTNVIDHGDPQVALKDIRIFDSGCSRHMIGNKSHLTDYQDYDGGFVAFVGSSKGGKITGKGKIRTRNLDFEDVYFVKELKFNLFSVSQMCDRKNSVLFTETECLILSPDFKLPDENQVILKIPRKDNMYSFDLKNIVPSKGLTFLIAKATNDESKLWHKRLGHINFKTLNKLVKGNLVRGLPSKFFENDHTCVACQKRKQHKATCRAPIISYMRPFGCPVTILNTLDHLGKFDGKADEGVLVGYSISSKAFIVYNHRTRKLEENLHVNFLENKPNVAGNGPKWLFDIDSLTNTMNYHPVSARNRSNDNAVPMVLHVLRKVCQEPVNKEEQILKDDVDNMMNHEKMATKHSDDARSQLEAECDANLFKGMNTRTRSTNSFNTVSTPLNTASTSRTNYRAGPSSGPPLMPVALLNT